MSFLSSLDNSKDCPKEINLCISNKLEPETV